jgi:hypothetical protein
MSIDPAPEIDQCIDGSPMAEGHSSFDGLARRVISLKD